MKHASAFSFALLAATAVSAGPLAAQVFQSSTSSPSHPSTGSADTKPNTFDCSLQGWVRAPDLSPGLQTEAHARLVLNGTECEQVVSWDVGLRLKERSILRFRAPNATLPSRPDHQVMNTPWSAPERKTGPDILNGFSGFYDHQQSPWDMAMREYSEALAARELWLIRAIGRDVFDSVTSLESNLNTAMGKNTIRKQHNLKASRTFAVDVPYTNFPPVDAGDHIHYISNAGEQDECHSETMFEYYFKLGLANESSIDVPAGKTGFIPAGVPVSTIPDNASVLHNRTIRLDKEGRHPYQRYDPIDQIDRKCDDALVADFEVRLELPEDGVFEIGSEHNISLHIRQLGNSTQFPTHIDVKPITCHSNTWAAQYASLEAHHRAADDCYAAMFDGRVWTPTKRLAMSLPVTIDDETESDDEEDGVVGVGMRRILQRRFNYKGNRLSGSEMGFNLTIPADSFPDYNTTFLQYKHLLQVTLTTENRCEHDQVDAAAVAIATEDEDLLHDSNWDERIFDSPYSKRQKARHQFQTYQYFGNTTIRLVPGAQSSATDIRHYTDERAQAITLSSKANPQPAPARQLVNTALVPEEKDEDLKKDKFQVWHRMPKCLRQNEGCRRGGAENLVSGSWERKIAIDALKARQGAK